MLLDKLLYIAGDFDRIGEFASYKQKGIESSLAFVNISDSKYTSLSNKCDGTIHQISWNETIYAVGSFNNIEPYTQSTGCVAYLDSEGVWKGVGSIFNQQANTIAIWGDSIIVGFENNVGLLNLGIYKDNVWNPLNGGVQGGSVKHILIHDDLLYVVGTFESVGSSVPNTRGIAFYDLVAEEWFSIAELEENEYINYVHVDNRDELIIVGSFNGLGTSDPNIARYVGNEWVAITNSPFPITSGDLLTVTTSESAIYVGGDFSIDTFNGIVAWNGTAWKDVSEGVECLEWCSAKVLTITPIPEFEFLVERPPPFDLDNFIRWKAWAIMGGIALGAACIIALVTVIFWRACSSCKS